MSQIIYTVVQDLYEVRKSGTNDLQWQRFCTMVISDYEMIGIGLTDYNDKVAKKI